MFLTDGALLPLNLYGVAFDRTAHAAPFLELFAEGFEGVGMLGNPGDDCNGLASPAFGFSPDAHNAIAGCKGPGSAADAFD